MSAEGFDQFLSVAVPRPLEGLFTYRVNREQAASIQPGSVVKVPFGRNTLSAVVMDSPRQMSELPQELSGVNIKEILEVGSSEFVVPDDVLSLCKWAQDYYRAPIGEVLGSALSLEMLRAKGKRTKAEPDGPIEIVPAHPLTDEQQSALGQLEQWRMEARDAASSAVPHVALLHGVTGSGKTELYLELARRTLAEGRSVLVLVPEIALTPQLHERFEKGLGIHVGLWHSALAAGERRRQWLAARSGEMKVIVGARSTVFAPIRDLGLILVDEEHDPSYKQEERARYQARDLAVVRGRINKAFVLLGSATPCLETLHRVAEGRYRKAVLKNRVLSGGMPTIDLVNMAEEPRVPDIRAPLAERTLEELRQTIASGKRAIVFLNRRGFAASLVCEDCGETPECPNCSISLTAHFKGTQLRCHVCGYHQQTPDLCPKCDGLTLFPVGAGTESLEEELPKLIPGAIAVRLDRDQITSAGRLKKALDSFRSGEANLLLGTQMLVKGHDFPEVTLVVVILADALFRHPDFRASERALQLLTQVSGRAGRGNDPGRVLIQTFSPEHPVLQVVKGQLQTEDFLKQESELREALSYPPYSRLARIRCEASTQAEARERAQIAAKATQIQGIDVLGPSEAALEKAKGKYRWDILLKAKEIRPLHQAIAQAKRVFSDRKWPLVVDVDPYSVG